MKLSLGGNDEEVPRDKRPSGQISRGFEPAGYVL